MYLHGKYCNGIRWNGKHSQTDFRATVTSRDIGMPEKKRYLESVPYSNVTYDFSALYGAQTYNRRTLKYEFTISSKRGWKHLRSRVQAFINWLYEPQGTAELRDSTDPEYHFNAELVSAVPSFLLPNLAKIAVTFEADPYRIPNENQAYPIDPELFPDVNGYGLANASDAAIILIAAANIGSGDPSGLTPEQERRADANRDGVINVIDAALVEEFSAYCGATGHANDPAGWTAFLNRKQRRKPEVL
ncbi:MAG: hypothetical protein K2I93_02710 [Oscillospiraceae bacterium]|nr:hypothetical protein [Oscillospiraceae bacterium]